MTGLTTGQTLFGRYAYPPNELGYCGPAEAGGSSGLASHAAEFDGSWPYLRAVAEALGSDALDEEVVDSYWVGGPALSKVDPADLLARLRSAFTGQLTGLLDEVSPSSDVLAHHSFHVFVVYPWVRFLGRDAATAVRVMQNCRIRWGTVESIDGQRAVISSHPLQFKNGSLALGALETETVHWAKGAVSLTPAPMPGTVVSAHWDWVCATLTETECAALEAATGATLKLVNSLVEKGVDR
ncbi:DUF6390 family protein [Mycolicibacterium sp. XJ2546]